MNPHLVKESSNNKIKQHQQQNIHSCLPALPIMCVLFSLEENSGEHGISELLKLY